MYIKTDCTEYPSTNPSILLPPITPNYNYISCILNALFADVVCSSVYCQNVGLGVEVFYVIKDEVVADFEGDEGCREDIASELVGEPSGNFVMKSTQTVYAIIL